MPLDDQATEQDKPTHTRWLSEAGAASSSQKLAKAPGRVQCATATRVVCGPNDGYPTSRRFRPAPCLFYMPAVCSPALLHAFLSTRLRCFPRSTCASRRRGSPQLLIPWEEHKQDQDLRHLSRQPVTVK